MTDLYAESLILPEDRCKYSRGVDCTAKNKCEKCGWNPEVQRERIRKIRQQEEENE